MQIDLVVSINTSSGKIIAGAVNFNPAQNTVASYPLKRCSDKGAVLHMGIAFAKIKKLKDIETEINLEKVPQRKEQKIPTSPIHDFSYASMTGNFSKISHSKVEV